MTTKQYVSDVITEEEYSKWTGKIILLGAGTGKGKTTFVKKYVKWLKTQGMKHFLYICNRTALREQINHNFFNIVGLDAINYQKLETSINSGNSMENYDKYDAFIMDECHYFLDDSAFNRYTDLVYWWLLKQQQHKTRIYMSATGAEIFDFIKKSVAELKEQDSQYNDEVYELSEEIQNQTKQTYEYVKNLCWMHSKRDVIKVFNAIKGDTVKAIYFADSFKKLSSVIEDASLKIKKDECCFYYANDSRQSAFARNHKKVGSIDEFVTDPTKRFLFSTIALDNGIDIEDIKVNHVICNVFDFNGTIQCLGRKRVKDDKDICNFYIMVPSIDELRDRYENVKEEIAEVNIFQNNPNEWEILDNRRIDGRDKKSRLIYYDPNVLDEYGRPKRTLNKLAAEKCRIIKENLELMLGKNEKNYHVPYETMLIEKLHIDYNKTRDIDNLSVFKRRREEQQKRLIDFIKSHIGHILTDDDLRELTQLCEIKTSGTPQVKTFNNYFEEYNIACSMQNKVRTINGTKMRPRTLERQYRSPNQISV